MRLAEIVSDFVVSPAPPAETARMQAKTHTSPSMGTFV
jgi:hypothetical protein